MDSTHEILGKLAPIHQQVDNQKVSAIKYNVSVTKSLRDAGNGNFYMIPEIYIPSIQCVYNHEAIFQHDGPRCDQLTDAVNIMVSKRIVDSLEQYFMAKNKGNTFHQEPELLAALDIESATKDMTQDDMLSEVMLTEDTEQMVLPNEVKPSSCCCSLS